MYYSLNNNVKIESISDNIIFRHEIKGYQTLVKYLKNQNYYNKS